MSQAILASPIRDSIPAAAQVLVTGKGMTVGKSYARSPSDMERAITTAGARLMAMRMPRLSVNPTKGEAQDLTRKLLDIAAIVDAALLEIGREARAHFGSGVDLECFTDVMRQGIEGNATHTICAAVEAEFEARGEANADARRELFRDWGTLPERIERMVAAE